MFKKSSIISLLFIIMTLSAHSSWQQLKFVDSCANGNTIGTIYMRDSTYTDYSFTISVFCDMRFESRSLVPPVRYFNTTDDSVMIDSYTVYRPFVQWN